VHRLKSREQYQAVLAGTTVARTAHFAMHSSAKDATAQKPAQSTQERNALFNADGVWLGAMVPKRWAKRAVTRNLIKRQIYNVANRYEALLPVTAHVIRLRAGFDRQEFISAASDQLKKTVKTEIELLLNKAIGAAPKVLA
jgi:ribonuclease P protein component